MKKSNKSLVNEDNFKHFVAEKISEKMLRRFKTLDGGYKKLWSHIVRIQEELNILKARLDGKK